MEILTKIPGQPAMAQTATMPHTGEIKTIVNDIYFYKYDTVKREEVGPYLNKYSADDMECSRDFGRYLAVSTVDVMNNMLNKMSLNQADTAVIFLNNRLPSGEIKSEKFRWFYHDLRFLRDVMKNPISSPKEETIYLIETKNGYSFPITSVQFENLAKIMEFNDICVTRVDFPVIKKTIIKSFRKQTPPPTAVKTADHVISTEGVYRTSACGLMKEYEVVTPKFMEGLIGDFDGNTGFTKFPFSAIGNENMFQKEITGIDPDYASGKDNIGVSAVDSHGRCYVVTNDGKYKDVQKMSEIRYDETTKKQEVTKMNIVKEVFGGKKIGVCPEAFMTHKGKIVLKVGDGKFVRVSKEHVLKETFRVINIEKLVLSLPVPPESVEVGDFIVLPNGKAAGVTRVIDKENNAFEAIEIDSKEVKQVLPELNNSGVKYVLKLMPIVKDPLSMKAMETLVYNKSISSGSGISNDVMAVLVSASMSGSKKIMKELVKPEVMLLMSGDQGLATVASQAYGAAPIMPFPIR